MRTHLSAIKGGGLAAAIGPARLHTLPPPCVLLSGDETDGAASTWAVAGDTDGVDGQEAVAGAVVCPHTLERFGDQVVTGPTLTNVNDFRAVLVR